MSATGRCGVLLTRLGTHPGRPLQTGFQRLATLIDLATLLALLRRSAESARQMLLPPFFREQSGMTVDQDAWTKSEINVVKRHYKKDLSASQIAEILGRSRNEVIGKAHRMGL